MDAFPGSTIAALCYTRETEIDFQRLATEMSTAVAGTLGGARLEMPTADFALCDTPGMRIGLARVALDHTFPGSLTGKHYPSCMVLSVGPGETIPEDPKEARYAGVRADLISRMQDIAAADRVLMFERAGAYDTDLHHAVVDDIRGHLDTVLCQRREPVSDVCRARAGRAPCRGQAAGRGHPGRRPLGRRHRPRGRTPRCRCDPTRRHHPRARAPPGSRA